MRIYIDMDGCLAKWDTETPAELTKVPGYFLAREKDEKIVELVKRLRAVGANICILSAVWNDTCAREKSEWLDQIFDKDLDRIFVPNGSNKADYILGGKSILIDDYTKNLKAWKSSGNVPIKFYNGINGNNGTYEGDFITKDMSVAEMIDKITQVAETM